MGFSTYESAKSAALAGFAKAGAKNAKISDPKESYTRFAGEMKKLATEYNGEVKKVQDKILAMKQHCQKVQAALDQYDDQVQKDFFGVKDQIHGGAAGPTLIRDATD